MREYNIVQLTEVLLESSNTTSRSNIPTEEIQNSLSRFLADGYEIYKAIPLVNENAMMVKYILRKKITK
jgi:hypothetical protein